MSLGRFASLLPAKLAPSFGPIMSFSSAKLRASGWQPQSEILKSISAVNSKIVQPWETALITGVGSGLGRAVFDLLCEEGINIIGVDVDGTSISQLQANYPQHVFLTGDVRDANLFETVVTIASKQEQRIDSIFLVAGMGSKVDFVDQSIENIDKQFEINVLARLHIANQFLRYVADYRIKSRIVFISSSSALQPLPSFATYCATNASLLSFGRSLSMELDRKKYHVVTVVPGGMDTQFQEKAGVKRLKNEKLLSPRAVAAKAINSSKRGSSVVVIGRNARITQVMARMLPLKVSDWLWARLTKAAR
jgi:short-subunit dehydrogenase